MKQLKVKDLYVGKKCMLYGRSKVATALIVVTIKSVNNKEIEFKEHSQVAFRYGKKFVVSAGAFNESHSLYEYDKNTYNHFKKLERLFVLKTDELLNKGQDPFTFKEGIEDMEKISQFEDIDYRKDKVEPIFD